MVNLAAALGAFFLIPLASAQQPASPAEQGKEKAKVEKPAAAQPQPGAQEAQRVLQLLQQRVQLQPLQLDVQPRIDEAKWVQIQLAQPPQVQNFQWVQNWQPQQVGQAMEFVVYRGMPDALVQKLPKAAAAMQGLDQAVQAAKSGEDKEAVLKALDDLERAVMKLRAALHEVEDGKKKEPAEKGGR